MGEGLVSDSFIQDLEAPIMQLLISFGINITISESVLFLPVNVNPLANVTVTFAV